MVIQEWLLASLDKSCTTGSRALQLQVYNFIFNVTRSFYWTQFWLTLIYFPLVSSIYLHYYSITFLFVMSTPLSILGKKFSVF